MEPLPGWYKGQKKECPRCGKTMYIQDAVPDGQRPNLQVCSKCRDKSEAERTYTDGGSQ